MNKQEQIKFIEDNYPLYTNHISNRRIRHTFFSKIETELQAYLLGFYAADGSINEKRKTLRIHLQKQDSELVYLFKDFISPDARTFSVQEHETTGRNGNKITAHESFGVDITSSELCNSLVELNIGYNKSYSDLHIPVMQEELIPHFIRGYFDGDGCITIKSTGYSVVSFCCNSKVFLENLKLYLESKSIICRNVVCERNSLRKKPIYILYLSKRENQLKFQNFIYSDKEIYLTRKYNKFMKIPR